MEELLNRLKMSKGEVSMERGFLCRGLGEWGAVENESMESKTATSITFMMSLLCTL